MSVEVDARRLLSDEEIAAALEDLPGWERQAEKLCATFNFSDFSEAFGFMSRVALVSERLFHHPEWSNVWSTVDIAITNHAAGGLTELDLEFARRVSKL
ncbi:4a-hydroxytetrahydrobiopterin dehydratase [Candidatus Poriferisocius sp.]|uniref:4a-hydroxytetrahydrobiopterin dehydratase n=1 Tax=Candidatus Poriferisocius sp. TaxID=3101276 RepID=UPI003B01DA95